MKTTSNSKTSQSKVNFVPSIPVAPLFESFYYLTEDTEAAREEVESSRELDKTKIEAFQLLKFKLEKVETKIDSVWKLNFFGNFSLDKLATSVAYTNYNLLQQFSCQGSEVDYHFLIPPFPNRVKRSLKLSPLVVHQGQLALKRLVDFQCYLTSSFAHLLVYQFITIHKASENAYHKSRMVEMSLTKVLQLAKILKTKFNDHNGYFGLLAALHHPALQFLLANLSYYPQLLKTNRNLATELRNTETELNENLGTNYFDNLFQKSTADTEQSVLIWGLPLASTLSNIIRNYGEFPQPNHTSFKVFLTQPGYLRVETLMDRLTPLHNLFGAKFDSINDVVYESWLLTQTFVSFEQLVSIVYHFFKVKKNINPPKLHYPKLLTIQFAKVKGESNLDGKARIKVKVEPNTEPVETPSDSVETGWLSKDLSLDFGWNAGWTELEGRPTTQNHPPPPQSQPESEPTTPSQLPDLSSLQASINALQSATQNIRLDGPLELDGSESDSETVQHLLHELNDEVRLENLNPPISFPNIPQSDPNPNPTPSQEVSAAKRSDLDFRSEEASETASKKSKLEEKEKDLFEQEFKSFVIEDGLTSFTYQVLGSVEVAKGSGQFVEVIGLADIPFFADDVDSEDEIFEG